MRLGERSKLEIKEKRNCKGKSYMLIKYGSLEGVFGDVIVGNHEVEYGYEGKWIVLLPKVVKETVVGVDKLWISGISNAGLPNIGVVNKDELSSNELEVGEKLSYLSESVENEKDIDKKTTLRILKGLEIKEKKEALSQTSGYFISNVIMSQMLDNGDRSMYEHVEMNGENKEGIDASENSPGRLEVNKEGVLAGVDIVRKEEVKVRVRCEFDRDWIKQGGNQGEVKNNGVGIYEEVSK